MPLAHYHSACGQQKQQASRKGAENTAGQGVGEGRVVRVAGSQGKLPEFTVWMWAVVSERAQRPACPPHSPTPQHCRKPG